MSIGTAELVAQAKTRIRNLSVEETHRAVTDDEALLIDIRDIRERDRLGTIPGSKHVARGLLEFWADPESHHYREFFDTDRLIILYCAGGGRSAISADQLTRMGYPNIAHLDVGFDGWKAACMPVEPAPYAPSENT